MTSGASAGLVRRMRYGPRRPAEPGTGTALATAGTVAAASELAASEPLTREKIREKGSGKESDIT